MEPISIHYRQYLGLIPLGLLLVGVGIYGFTKEVDWWICLLVLIIGVIFCGLMATVGTFTDTFSQEGITMKRLFRTRTIPWCDVIHAGIICLRADDDKPFEEIVFVFRGGELRNGRRNVLRYLIKNAKNTLHVKYTAQLASLVEKHYGALKRKKQTIACGQVSKIFL